MLTKNFIVQMFGKKRFSGRQNVWVGGGFIVFIVVSTYVISIFKPLSVFNLSN